MSRGLGDVYKRQSQLRPADFGSLPGMASFYQLRAATVAFLRHRHFLLDGALARQACPRMSSMAGLEYGKRIERARVLVGSLKGPVSPRERLRLLEPPTADG